ncbi:transcription elongation factor GreA [Bradymonadaceae bacterium TMQ3]|uniref:Transcription elongation factor GreA n=1 Tax=Lujinxingia sediminis TaxID=2480984 RepID=A0ABY0CY94_9DELT|nr:transcription elongation factor GreA [Lujinxingia sediminis]RDV39277.1 transcription elongation factor GreA [Bradymonadaceae bacterium TMQ3]RVU48684.1 transcription elongation factor GreA [Lujinxingia sediminis]TXC77977.1 transcription elongation factor GreA [Bradymonadales bacterium TMQ1]
MQKIPMTVDGHRKLREELDNLKKVQRPRIVQEIEEARAHGDLKENAEYHAAKDKQGFVEGRIREIEGKLAHAQVIDTDELGGDRVVFGAFVTVFFLDTDEEKTYQIVGDDEADIKQLKISFASPIARALIGKTVGDESVIKAPGGDRVVEIMEVEFR